MTCPHCGCTAYYAGGGLLSCAACGKWLEPDAEPILQPELQVAIESVVIANDPPPAVAAERTVTIAGTGRGTTKKRGKR